MKANIGTQSFFSFFLSLGVWSVRKNTCVESLGDIKTLIKTVNMIHICSHFFLTIHIVTNMKQQTPISIAIVPVTNERYCSYQTTGKTQHFSLLYWTVDCFIGNRFLHTLLNDHNQNALQKYVYWTKIFKCDRHLSGIEFSR